MQTHSDHSSADAPMPLPPKRRSLGLAVGLLIAVAAIAAALLTNRRSTPSIALTTGPMVQQVTSEGFLLTWRVAPAEPLTLRVVSANGDAIGDIRVDREQDRWSATVSGLQPETRYRYSLTRGDATQANEQPLGRGSTRTAPAAPGSFKLLAFGDSGSGDTVQYSLAKVMAAQSPDLIVHTGDLIYPDGARGDYASKFFRPYAAMLATVPFYPSVGNHDYQTEAAAPMFEEFVLPRNGPKGQTPERHYWFDYGCARFISIDTDLGLHDLQDQVAPWLDETLTAAGDLWKICFFHHPVVTNGKTYEPTFRVIQSLVPVMERRGVALVLNGHNHMYERSHPIRGGAIVPAGEGIVYVVTGAGGDELYAERTEASPLIAFHDARQHSFTVIDVAPGAMHLQQINDQGRPIDEYDLRSHGLTAPGGATAPPPPPAAVLPAEGDRSGRGERVPREARP